MPSPSLSGSVASRTRSHLWAACLMASSLGLARDETDQRRAKCLSGSTAPGLPSRSLTCPYDARTSTLPSDSSNASDLSSSSLSGLVRNFCTFFALVGDSTTTSVVLAWFSMEAASEEEALCARGMGRKPLHPALPPRVKDDAMDAILFTEISFPRRNPTPTWVSLDRHDEKDVMVQQVVVVLVLVLGFFGSKATSFLPLRSATLWWFDRIAAPVGLISLHRGQGQRLSGHHHKPMDAAPANKTNRTGGGASAGIQKL
mmetsp:Transcript_2710/g.9334  ORF Transcript_2710/g.9334 Transcript_2710/m.9334 type:complete len:258 (+) Transcript_2710:2240-3013(+)